MSSSSVHSSTFTVTLEELKSFHKIDRTLYTKLVFDVGRDIKESMHVIAFWLWLERSTKTEMVRKLLSFSNPIVSLFADEAVECLKCIMTSTPCDLVHNIPLTQNLTNTPLALYLHISRPSAQATVSNIYNDVCTRVLRDIASQATEVKEQFRVWQTYLRNQCSSSYVNTAADGDRITPPSCMDIHRTETLESSNLMSYFNKRSHPQCVPESPSDDRTVFLTFSKGYPILAEEIVNFITRKFGDCIEELCMQEVLHGEQPLHARLVVRSEASVQLILDGEEKAKFSVNGKHVWVRKYVFHKPSGESSSIPLNH